MRSQLVARKRKGTRPPPTPLKKKQRTTTDRDAASLPLADARSIFVRPGPSKLAQSGFELRCPGCELIETIGKGGSRNGWWAVDMNNPSPALFQLKHHWLGKTGQPGCREIAERHLLDGLSRKQRKEKLKDWYDSLQERFPEQANESPPTSPTPSDLSSAISIDSSAESSIEDTVCPASPPLAFCGLRETPKKHAEPHKPTSQHASIITQARSNSGVNHPTPSPFYPFGESLPAKAQSRKAAATASSASRTSPVSTSASIAHSSLSSPLTTTPPPRMTSAPASTSDAASAASVAAAAASSATRIEQVMTKVFARIEKLEEANEALSDDNWILKESNRQLREDGRQLGEEVRQLREEVRALCHQQRETDRIIELQRQVESLKQGNAVQHQGWDRLYEKLS